MPNFNFNMFQRNAKKNVNKSFKDLSHEWKHDFSLGFLTPCLCIPTLPGDEFEIESQFYFQFDPLYFPMIHRVNLDCDYFWVRNANMWKAVTGGDGGWLEFIMLKEPLSHPTVDVDMRFYEDGATFNDSIYGYIGVPYLMFESGVRTTTITGLNAFVAMAYLQIYDQYYLHPQLETPRVQQLLVGGDNTGPLVSAFGYMTPTNVRLSVFPAKWGKDYFTSCLPTPQVGDPVQIPLVDPKFLDPDSGIPTGGPFRWRDQDTNLPATQFGNVVIGGDEGQSEVDGERAYLDIQETAATIRELSLSSVLQTLKEQLMRFGQRYKDWIDSAFDEDIDPLDLDLPLMIGSYRGSVNVSTTMTQANTTVGESNFFTGDYTGNASLFENGNRITFKCRDYGVLMAIFSLTPNTGYGQGIPRWLRYSDPFDYPMDIFCGVGDQEILKEEVFYNNKTSELAKNGETFGYGVRYQEAFTIPNNYGSNFAWNAGLSMHLGKYYDPVTMIGSEYDDFIEINRNFLLAGDTLQGGTRVRDVFKTLTTPLGQPTANVVQGYILHKIGAKRPLPAFSTPSLGI